MRSDRNRKTDEMGYMHHTAQNSPRSLLRMAPLKLILPRDAMLARYMLSSRVRLSVRLSVCLSQAGSASRILDESSFLAWGLPSTYPILCGNEIWVPPKIRVLPCATLPQTPDLNFATASRSHCQRRSSSSI